MVDRIDRLVVEPLPSSGWDNNVARITQNVLDAFARPGSLPGGQYIEEEKAWR